MEFKSALQWLADDIAEHPQDRKLRDCDGGDKTREGYVDILKTAKHSIKIVAGEANNKLFDRTDFRAALKGTLDGDPDSTVALVFHKDPDMAMAKQGFVKDNPKLLSLKHEYGSRVHLSWSPVRPTQHYAVIDDGESAVLEQPNHTEMEPFWATVTTNPKRAKGWAARFDEYVRYCEELKFGS